MKYLSIKNFRWAISILCLVLGLLAYYLTYNPDRYLDEIVLVYSIIFNLLLFFGIYRFIERPLSRIFQNYEHLFSGNTTNQKIDDMNLAEFRSFSRSFRVFSNTFNEVKNYITELENGNLDFDMKNHEGQGLRGSIYRLQQQLLSVRNARKQNTWANKGLALFADIFRNDSGNIDDLGKNIISSLVKYTKSNHAGLYVLEDDGEHLKQIAFFAYDRDRYTDELIPKGFGLLWQCLHEKKPIHLTEIPDDYIEVKSGLGGATPNSIIMIPLMLEERTFGVIELASFNKYEQYVIEFIEKLAENIASSIANARTNKQTRELLELSELKTQELQEQEQTMRQNMEELQATQEQMAVVQADLRQKEYNINALLNSSDDTFFAIDTKYRIFVVNKTLKDRYANSGIELKEGVNIFDCIPEDQHEIWLARYDRSLAGENYILDMEREVDGKTQYLRGYYNCIRDNDGIVIGASVRSSDITEFNDLNLELIDLKKKYMELQDKKGIAPTTKKGSSKESEIIKKAKADLKKLKKK